MEASPKYRRILLKLSGEALVGSEPHGIDPRVLSDLAQEIKEIWSQGVQIALVVGAGNIFRGAALNALGLERATADYMGMVATVANALALQDALQKKEVPTRILSAFGIRPVVEPFVLERAMHHLQKGRVLLLGAGTGHPYFTTDTAACLRALEIQAEVVLKATRVDGVYSDDPLTNKAARFFPSLGYDEVLAHHLRVMDATAIALAREYNLPIIVFNLTRPGNIRRVVMGEPIGTLVSRNADPRRKEE